MAGPRSQGRLTVAKDLRIDDCVRLGPLQRDPGAWHARGEACPIERLGPGEEQPRTKCRWAFDQENAPKRARVGMKGRLLQREVLGALSPRWSPQSPPLREVLSRRSDPRVDKRIADDLGNRIDPSLLGRLVPMVEVKFVHEFVERHREVGNPYASDLSNFGQGLGSRHVVRPFKVRIGTVSRV